MTQRYEVVRKGTKYFIRDTVSGEHATTLGQGGMFEERRQAIDAAYAMNVAFATGAAAANESRVYLGSEIVSGDAPQGVYGEGDEPQVLALGEKERRVALFIDGQWIVEGIDPERWKNEKFRRLNVNTGVLRVVSL